MRKGLQMENRAENRYPLFAGGRILKKEALWDLRDYAYGSWQLYYGDYTDGVVRGCRVRVEGSRLAVGRGILKFGDYIYLLGEEAVLPCRAENRMLALKAVLEIKRGHPDEIGYGLEFLLDEDMELGEGQIELCRFHLREGSVLRDAYKDFEDMRTEYDTVNLLHATVAGRGQRRLHPEILLRFAKEMQENDKKSMEDTAFCYEIWNHGGEVERALVEAYLRDKGADPDTLPGGEEEVFRKLADILSRGTVRASHRGRQNVIYVE